MKLREPKDFPSLAVVADAPQPNKSFFYRPYLSDNQTIIILDLLERMNDVNLECFEYGAGFSTVFFPRFIKCCYRWVSVEHLPFFIERITPYVEGSVTIIHKEIWNGYPEEILKNGKFDFVFVDGERREECIFYAANALRDGGMIVRHDAGSEDVPIYREGDKTYDLRREFEETGVVAGLWWGRK